MAFAVLIFIPDNLLIILHLYLNLSYLSRDLMMVTTPTVRSYESLYMSQLLSAPNMTEYSHLHNPRRSPATPTHLWSLNYTNGPPKQNRWWYCHLRS